MLKEKLKRFLSFLPWVWQDYIYYAYHFRRIPRIKRPQMFSEKVLFRKHFGDFQKYSRLADKFLVRDYIEDLIGGEYLVPLIYHTQDPDELSDKIDWRNVVIKPSHGAGMVELIGSEGLCDQRRFEIIENCKRWLATDYSLHSREMHYRSIERRILVEKLLGDGVIPPNDYKFHCFRDGGNFGYVLQLVNDRFSDIDSRGYFLNSLDNCVWHHGRGNHSIPSEHVLVLLEAVRLSKEISKDFDYVRVDWYVHDGRLYFGELTFTPGAGLVNEFGEFLEKKMGSMWNMVGK